MGRILIADVVGVGVGVEGICIGIFAFVGPCAVGIDND